MPLWHNQKRLCVCACVRVCVHCVQPERLLLSADDDTAAAAALDDDDEADNDNAAAAADDDAAAAADDKDAAINTADGAQSSSSISCTSSHRNEYQYSSVLVHGPTSTSTRQTTVIEYEYTRVSEYEYPSPVF